MNSGHGGGNIDQVDLSEEARQFGGISVVDAILPANIFMHIPAGNFAIIDSINQILGSNDIATGIDMRFIGVLHGMSIDDNFIVLTLDQGFDGLLFVLGAESADNIIRFYHNFFIGEFVFFSVEEILLELYS